MFTKVLIANRGAIAVRVERTLAKMGIKSVAVYSKADRDSLHVLNADEKVYLGEGTAKETYLDVKKIINAAKSWMLYTRHSPGLNQAIPSLPA